MDERPRRKSNRIRRGRRFEASSSQESIEIVGFA